MAYMIIYLFFIFDNWFYSGRYLSLHGAVFANWTYAYI